MSEEDKNKSVGINISAGGNVHVEASRDIIAGNQTITQYLDQNNEKKEEFVKELEELRTQLRDLRSEIINARELDEDTKDELVGQITQQVTELKEDNVSQNTMEHIKETLDKSHTILESLKTVGKDVVEFGTAAAPYIAKGGAILLSLRSLLGIP